MTTVWLALKVVHLLGMALMVGAAAVKATLLAAACRDAAFSPAYLRVAKPVTRVILVGLVLATATGIGWLALGRPLTPMLTAKIAFAAGVWAIGPVIDKVLEPRFARAVAGAGAEASMGLARAGRRYLAAEVAATALAGAACVLGALL